ncbi:flagellar biosynthesis protein FliQ [bacterium]|jgi:flagellar biosynthetic protein FliQ|uniref:Flagellar biosynthetic protein FliQ n=1 Tax=Planktomarina temperata RCA23 TaxID=666509 RepID=A0AAN0RHH7_9RHOB|nr:flagellar biosynthetic protein FliQ [Planktomarina temperata RCA23]MDA7798274.1 flagellar biosynthesis protein FliQ [bacterium]MDA8770766.1 flagellar biosynthesis protein FliQ [Planktomarina temperata]MDA8830665.1 flagellar biosynthesis protein FliQ [Planktomarina temperata]MDA8954434.1 flagellar biosynthesis protein FliQ [Planktomarina temperata]
MEFDGNIEYLRLAFWQIIMTAGPVLGVALAIGLLVGVLQAATSINEMTLSFVPKLILVLTTIALLSGLMMTQMSNYFAFIFQEISLVGR